MTGHGRRAHETGDGASWGAPASGERSARGPLTPPDRQAAAPSSFSPRFGWRADAHDFPVTIPAATRERPTERAPAVATTSAPEPATSGAQPPVSPFPYAMADEPHPLTRFILPALVVLIVAGAIAALALRDDGGDDDDDGNIAGGPTATVTTQSGSILGTPGGTSAALRTPTPGEGGAPGDDTPAPGETPDDGLIIITVTPGVDVDATEPIDGEPAGTEPAGEPTEPVAVSPGEPQPVSSTVEVNGQNSLVDIADSFGLAVSTLLWANLDTVQDPTLPVAQGTHIVVPYADGVLHTVAEGETLEGIAARYGVTVEAITGVWENAIASDADLRAGQTILVRDGKLDSRDDIATYTVREGDDVWQIARYYGLEGQTVAFANNIPDPYLIYPEQQLVIPPTDGLLLRVEWGDTVESLAARFSVDPSVIRNYPFNGLSGEGSQPIAGQYLMIPEVQVLSMDGGKGSGQGAPAETEADTAPPAADAGNAQATGTFAWPTDGYISQGFHSGHVGIDLANVEGTGVFASDGGVVTFAGWNDYGLGFAVEIDHENGYVTWYGHLSAAPDVSIGQRVAQGQWLGPMGTTGKSTGPHLHFILMRDGVYQDPLAYLP